MDDLFIVARWNAQYFACAEADTKEILGGLNQGSQSRGEEDARDVQRHHLFADHALVECNFGILLNDNQIVPSDDIPSRVSATFLPLDPYGGTILKGITGIIQIDEGIFALVLAPSKNDARGGSLGTSLD